MSTGPDGPSSLQSQGCRGWPSVGPSSDWRQLFMTLVDLCPCLFTPRASCHAPEPISSNKALCPLCTHSTSWSFLRFQKLHVPSRAGLQHISIHTRWFLLQNTSAHVLLCFVFWFGTKVGKHHTLFIICIWNKDCNILLQICTSSTEAVSQSSCWTHCTWFYLSICPASVSRKNQSILFFSIIN